MGRVVERETVHDVGESSGLLVDSHQLEFGWWGKLVTGVENRTVEKLQLWPCFEQLNRCDQIVNLVLSCVVCDFRVTGLGGALHKGARNNTQSVRTWSSGRRPRATPY